MSSKLSLKITVPIALISALAIGLTAFLNIGKFDRTLSDLEKSRLQFVVGDIKANLETGLTLGLHLKSLENAQSVIDNQAKEDANILVIVIYDENGAILFHSGTKKFPPTIPAAWQQAAKGIGERSWYLKEKEESSLVVASTLAGGISQDVGGVAIRYSMESHQNTLLTVQQKLALASLVTIFITVLLTYIGISFLTRKTDQKLKNMEQQLEKEVAPDFSQSTISKINGMNKISEKNPDYVMLNKVIQTSDLAMQDLTKTEQELRTAIATQSEKISSADTSAGTAK